MTKTTPIIHIVDDDPSFCAGTAELLKASGYRVSLYGSAVELLKAPPGSEPACILLDVQMAGLKGPQLQDQLVELGCKVPIVFISGHADIPITVKTIKAGAEDFLTKPADKTKLLDAIGRALARHEEIRAGTEQVAALRSRLSRLTLRELEVFQLLVRGNLHKQIAHVLGVSERTVKSHRHNVLEKLQVRSLADLAVMAERLGMMEESGLPANPATRSAKPQPKAIS